MNIKYKVEVKTERNGKDTYLAVTHNGYQWTSISICDSVVEIPLIIDALQRHLTPAAPDSEGRAVLEGDVYHIEYVEEDKIVLTRCQ